MFYQQRKLSITVIEKKHWIHHKRNATLRDNEREEIIITIARVNKQTFNNGIMIL